MRNTKEQNEIKKAKVKKAITAELGKKNPMKMVAIAESINIGLITLKKLSIELGYDYKELADTIAHKRSQYVNSRKNNKVDNDTPNLLLRRLWI